ncbi:MAG: radical SAM protein [Anaerolineaceae bacterium]|nr:radical SAM protein [Anaerolineaceae bacterium]
MTDMIAFGPVPSRRLGFSLGINHIPPKHCSYACVYCQVGATSSMTVKRQSFYPVSRILDEVRQKVEKCAALGQKIDYFTFVPDGEPTLDENLAEEIQALRQFNIPIAVISNATLLHQQEVRETLKKADWVSLKVDSMIEATWRKINRPHGHLNLETMQASMKIFAAEFKGELVTETMLISSLNDTPVELTATADFLSTLSPHTAYISAPIRPPAETWVHVPDTDHINRAYQIFASRAANVELITNPEDITFALTSNLQNDILSITAVHPMRQDAVEELIRKSGETWQAVEELLTSGALLRLAYEEETFYLRQLKR